MIGIQLDSECQDVALSFWSLGDSRPSVPCRFPRLHMIWRIIRSGHPYTDQILLQRDKLGELIEYLIMAYRKLENDEGDHT